MQLTLSLKPTNQFATPEYSYWGGSSITVSTLLMSISIR